MQQLFPDPSFNAALCNAGMFPVTVGLDKENGNCPVIGMVVDWDSANGKIYQVVEYPVFRLSLN